ncbi:MAG: oligopeptide:H+ symporter [Legionellaceae bacterium]|nr:oligopeptide:H+ symporter [Legionellaceae bacterium]
MFALLRQQPRPFFMIFMLEIWERFGFYSVQGILVLYFIRYLGFSNQVAYYTFGAFCALIYSMVPLGGFLGDKLLGTKRTIVLGLIVLSLGYFSLAWVDKNHVFWALGLICIGNGLFKANPATLLAKCYEHDRPSVLHAGFTLYYMAINLGAIAALFVGPVVSSRYGYSYSYMISGTGIIFALINYWSQHKHIANIDTPADQYTIRWYQWVIVVAGILLIAGMAAYLLQHVAIAKLLIYITASFLTATYFYCIYKEEQKEVRQRLLLAFILMLEAIVFFTLYQQMPTSINLFAVDNVNTTLFGIHLDPQSFQVLNPTWIILMSPVLASFYAYLQRKQISFPVPYKFALGMTCCGISFLVLFMTRYVHDEAGMVSSWWLVASYFFQSIGELLVSALGIAMVAELVSQRIMGFVMGMWYLTSALAGLTGATVASYAALPKSLQPGVESLMLYTHVFAAIGVVTLVVAVFLWLISPRLTRMMTIESI